MLPNPSPRRLAAGGMAFSNSTDAATAYPHLWRTRAAAKSALQRGEKLDARDLARLHYQKAGRRFSPAVAWFDPGRVLDPAAAVAEKLGRLAWSRVAEPAELAAEAAERARVEAVARERALIELIGRAV